jgi:hypothetical protein
MGKGSALEVLSGFGRQKSGVRRQNERRITQLHAAPIVEALCAALQRYLADCAFAIDQGAQLCSGDNDFARFPTLRWKNPLAIR